MDLCEINLERHLELDEIFKTLDLGRIIPELEGLLKKKINKGQSLLFLDEIQATPNAIPALRYLYEELPQLHVAAAGSLLEFTLKDHSFSMPVGRVQYLHLGPMVFEEFLLALGEEHAVNELRNFHFDKKFPESVHKQLLALFREYIFCGGMPEAVLNYSEQRSWDEVSKIHRSIIDTYQDDFSKYARKQSLILLQQIFQRVPQFAGLKVKYTNFSRELPSREVKEAIELLIKARIITAVVHSNCSGLPIRAGEDKNVYKLFFLDVGLMLGVMGFDWRSISTKEDYALVNEGALAEQFVAQHLPYVDGFIDPPYLSYWLREGKSGNSEVDFVISKGDKIIPIEVKAGKSGTLKSLHQFAWKKQAKFAFRFDLNPPSSQNVQHAVFEGAERHDVNYTMYSLPLYLVGEFKRLANLY